MATDWVLGKTVISRGREIAEVLGQAAVLPGFDIRDELVLTNVSGGFTLRMQVALYAAIAQAKSSIQVKEGQTFGVWQMVDFQSERALR